MHLVWLIIVLLSLYVVFIVLPSIMTAAMTFLPKKSAYTDIESLKGTYYEKYSTVISESASFFKGMICNSITTEGYDGTVLHSDYYKNGDSRKLALFIHGFRGTPLIHFPVQAKFMYEKGYNVAFVYQRSHNGLEGKRVGLGTVEKYDVISWCEYYGKNTANTQCILYGTSMGCTSVELASDRLNPSFVKAMVLDCGYNSVYSQMKFECKKRHLPANLIMPYIKLTAKLMLNEDITDETYNHLALCSIPKFFIHGKADKTVDYRKTEITYNKCTSEKALFIAENAEHTVSFLESTDAAKEKLSAFLNKAVS